MLNMEKKVFIIRELINLKEEMLYQVNMLNQFKNIILLKEEINLKK